MVSQAIANLTDSDLSYLEKLLGKEFTQQHEKRSVFKAKNGYTYDDDSKILLRLMNAVRSQKKLLTMDKW